MRMMPSRYLMGKPAQIKRTVAQIKHVSAPLKGLSLSSKLLQGDPLTASVLDNWVIEENQIRCRSGTLATVLDLLVDKPIDQLVPYYGAPSRLAAAGDGKLVLFDNTLLKDGFTGNDWSCTAFTDLSTTDYTVMVNGRDGVWSWDGGAPNAPPVASLGLYSTNPATVGIPTEDMAKFSNGMTVVIAGGTGPYAICNGAHVISNVNTAPNSFTIPVNAVGAGPPQTEGVTVTPPGTGGGMVKEAVTAPATATWLNVDQLNIVIAHQNRLFFSDSSNLCFYYLPIQQKSGELKAFPLNAIFKRGGTIRAMYTWTTEGGININDQLVIFSSNGEAAVYSGVDPDTDFQLGGLFRFDAPMSKHSVVNYGGELYVLISTGLVPFSTLMRAESEQLGQSDRNVFSNFSKASLAYRDVFGWSVTINPSSGRVICNMPQGGRTYSQMVRFMPNPVWATWSALPSRCWGWIDNRMFFGSDDGRVYEIHPRFLSDDSPTGRRSIKVDVQAAWSNYGSPAMKHFRMVLPYIQTDGTPRPFIDIKVDYDLSTPTNQPDVTDADLGATWDEADWDEDFWAGSAVSRNYWSGVGVIGRVAGPRLVAEINGCEFSLTGWDVMFENGAAI